MATLTELEEGLRKAHAAGNAEHARAFANAIRQMRAAGEQTAPRDLLSGEGSSPAPWQQDPIAGAPPAAEATPDASWLPNPLEPASRLASDFMAWGADDPNYQPSAVPWLDPINAGLNKAVDSIPVVGPKLTEVGNQVDAWFNNALGFEEQTAADRAVINQNEANRFPQAALAGQVVGTVAPLAAMGATQVGGQVLGVTGNLGQRVLMGGISGGALSAADTIARGGTTEDARNLGLMGAGLGAGFPIAGHLAAPVARAFLGTAPSKGAQMLAPALRKDGITSETEILRLLAAGGDEIRLADLGPNAQGQAAAIATRPGDAQRVIIEALTDRQQGGNARIRAAADGILGPAPVPSYVQAEIRANQQALQPAYREALQGASPVDTSPVAQALDDITRDRVGPSQRAAQQIRNWLDEADAPGTLSADPGRLLSVRNAIDGLFEGEANPQVIGVLSEARRAVDDILSASVPGIKEVDAQFAELARQSDALGNANSQTMSGRKFLGQGPDAPVPAEVADLMASGAIPEGMMIGPSGEAFRFSQSARAEIERIIGTGANDRVALQRLLKGEGSWNYDRLVSTFGQDKADSLLAVLSRERMMAETEALALAGSRTAPVTAAQKELFDQRNPGVIRQGLNMNFGDAAARAADMVAGGYFQQQRQRAMVELAELLMAGQNNREAVDEVARALAMHQQGIFPPSSAPMLLLPEPERQLPR